MDSSSDGIGVCYIGLSIRNTGAVLSDELGSCVSNRVLAASVFGALVHISEREKHSVVEIFLIRCDGRFYKSSNSQTWSLQVPRGDADIHLPCSPHQLMANDGERWTYLSPDGAVHLPAGAYRAILKNIQSSAWTFPAITLMNVHLLTWTNLKHFTVLP